MPVDTQIIEILGRNRLAAELLRDGLEVASPVRDRGIDLIAYADLGRQVSNFVARPIQMKAASGRTFGVERKYERIADIIIAYVWFVDGAQPAVTYALSYPEAVGLAERMGWTATESWAKGRYVTNNPVDRLVQLLEPFRIVPGRWWDLITGRPAAESVAPSS
jgi:hypothetical protein